MRRRAVRLSCLAAIVVLGLLVAFLVTRPVEQGATRVSSPLVGTEVPAVTASTIAGGPSRVALASLRGRVVVLSFFASWCASCADEAPNFVTFAYHVQRSHAPVTILGVVFNDDVSAARAFAAKYGLTFPVLDDPGGAIANDFGVDGPPVTIVVNARGRVADVLDGPATASQLANLTALAQ